MLMAFRADTGVTRVLGSCHFIRRRLAPLFPGKLSLPGNFSPSRAKGKRRNFRERSIKLREQEQVSGSCSNRAFNHAVFTDAKLLNDHEQGSCGSCLILTHYR